jgi:hypothetical protein
MGRRRRLSRGDRKVEAACQRRSKNELPTFNRIAEEHLKDTSAKKRRERVGQVFAVIFLAACILEAIFLGPRSSRTQKEIERALSELQLPPQTTQDSYHSGHASRKGYAEKVVASTQSPQDVCDFYMTRLVDGGWSLEHGDCQLLPQSRFRANASHGMLEFRKADVTCRVAYVGARDGKNRYSIRIDWLD